MPVNCFSFGGGDANISEDPDVTVMPDGRIIVSYLNYPYIGAEGDVFVRFYDADGVALGGPILVQHVEGDPADEYSGAWPSHSDVSVLANGNILVVWSQEALDTEPANWTITDITVHGQVLDPSGSPVGEPFLIRNSAARDNDPEITALDNGGFVVVWYSSSQSGGTTQMQVYDSAGNAVSGIVSPAQGQYEISSLAGGGFVVASATNNGGIVTMSTRTYNLSGVATGPAVTLGTSGAVSVSGLADGGYVAAWTSGTTVRSQIFTAENVAVNSITTLSTPPYPVRQEVVGTVDGGYVIVWAVSSGSDSYTLFGQRFTADGIVSGGIFEVAAGVNFPADLALAATLDGGVVAVWENGANDSIHGSVISGIPLLFSPGADGVNFNALTPDQALAVDSGSQLYDAGLGNDTVTLPNANVTTIRPGVSWNPLVYSNGGGGVDTIHGGDRDDRIDGGADGDFLYGNGGMDTINGGDGVDLIFGGSGVDTLLGGDGNDFIYGGAEGDTIVGDGLLAISGFTGDDNLFGQDGDDTIYGGAGKDTIHGGNDSDTIYGGTGNDTIHGDAGVDTIYGDAGNDTIHGGEGADTLRGGADDDYIVSGDNDGDDAGGNFLFGEGGNDVLVTIGSDAGAAADQLTGGGGTDFFIVDTRQGGEDLIMDFEIGETAATFLTGDPRSYVIVSQDSGTTVVVYDANGGVAARFEFDTQIPPSELRVTTVTNDEGVEFLAVQRSADVAGAIAAALAEWAPVMQVIAEHIYDGLKDDLGSAISGEFAPRAVQFLQAGFAANPVVLNLAQTVIDKIKAALPGITDEALAKIAEQIVDQIGQFVIGEVIEAFESGKPPSITSNDTFDLVKTFAEPILVAVPGGTALVRISDFLNTSIMIGMDTYFAAETVDILNGLPDVATGSVTVVGPNGNTGSVPPGGPIPPGVASNGEDTLYTQDSIEQAPDGVENIYQLDPYGEQGREIGTVAAVNSTVGGNALDNQLTGNHSANQILGRAGNDVLIGRGGNDVLDGGSGEDTAVYGDAIGNYTIMFEGSALRITHLATGSASEGSDLVSGVEWFWFGSQLMSFAEVAAMAPNPPVIRATLTLTELGQDYLIGGDVLVYGTTAPGEVIEVLHGDVLLDVELQHRRRHGCSARRCGRLYRELVGLVRDHRGRRRSAWPFRSGSTGLSVQFEDSTRTLRYDTSAGQVVLGTQAGDLGHRAGCRGFRRAAQRTRPRPGPRVSGGWC